MVEKQKRLHTLLKEIDTICKNNGIEYVLSGGTLLGAVRNRGFIPWDDDIDIMMTRDNWEKLKEAAKTQLPPNRALVASELDSNYTKSFPRYMDTTVTAIHKPQIPGRDKAGEIIDIFVLDPIPDDDNSYRRYVEEIMMYSDIVNDWMNFGGRWEVSPWKYIKYKLTSLLRGKKYALSKIEKKIFSYPEEQCHYYAMRWGGVPFRFEKRWFDSVKLAPFEDIMAMIPKATNEYLTWHYGDDWMFVPHVTERGSHASVDSTEVDYRTIQREYLPRINIFRYEWGAFRRKIKGMMIAKRDHSYNTYLMEMQAYNHKTKCEQKLLETGVYPGEFTNALPVSALADLFEEYFAFQFNRETIGREDDLKIYRFNNPVLVDLEPDFFYAAVYTLFHTQGIAKAKRLIDIWKQHHEVDERLAQIENSIQIYREAMNLFIDEDNPYEAEKLVNSLLDIFPHNISLLKLKLQLCAVTGNDELKKILENCQEMWPEDGEFIKYQADLVLQNKNMQEAFPLYISAYSNTNNGMIHLQIAELMKDYFQEILLALKGNFNNEIAEKLQEIFYNQEDILEQIYHLQIEKAEDIHAVDTILERMKKDRYYYDALKEIFLSLGVHGDAVNWKLENIYGIGPTGSGKLLETILSFKEERPAEKISASIWKLLGDLHEANGMEKEAIGYYWLATCSELCELERYEIYHTVSAYLWTGNTTPIKDVFKQEISFLKWYQNLYTISDCKETGNDEIAANIISII